MRNKRRGMTFPEILVILAMFAVLLGLLVPVLQAAREAGQRTQCLNNLHQVVMAAHHYHDQRGHLPPYASGRQGEIYGSWLVHLLPFLEQEPVYQTILTHSVPTHSPQGTLAGNPISIPGVRDLDFAFLLCPSDFSANSIVGWGKTNYLANWYAFSDEVSGPYSPPQPFSALKNGLSQVVLFAEAYRECDGLARIALISENYHNFGITSQSKPSDDPSYLPQDYTMFQIRPNPRGACHPWRTQTPHAAMPAAFADGSIRSLDRGISPAAWKQLLKPRD